ncbi:UPF0716 protein FxsA [Spinactinospora alkalitolerans]|uniref:UPF0716 protein FxsA n=1 Tax=Spinactinospora alkalitolerans TaxID=687207 RepID=A0A852TU39_9ACTN|nr:FxsA family protein [Spinactinospora alkalitolerans]NYE46975.1 UPF0716 protein FxsA [Spinactinospora alkalitolerans]
MPLLIGIALMALPFLEIWAMILVGQQIGAAWTIAALFALSVAGMLVIRRAGTRAFRDVDAAMRTGTPPRTGGLDMLMLFVGGVLLVVPGFITAVLGLALSLPFTRPALRWAFTGWARRRMERMNATVDGDARNGPLGAHLGARRPDAAARPPGSGKVVQGHVVTEDEHRD